MTASAEQEAPTLSTPTEVDAISGGCLIAKSSFGWSVTAGTQTQRVGPDALVEQVVETLLGMLATDKAVAPRCVLALPAEECFFAAFTAPASLQIKDPTAVAYHLERILPLDAESMVADHRVDRDGERVVAVATSVERHRGLVDALEHAGIELVAIVPATVLVARAVRDWRSSSEPFLAFLFEPPDIIASASHALDENASEENTVGCDQVVVDANGLTHWKHCADANELSRHYDLTSDPNDAVEPLVVVGRDRLDFSVPVALHWCPLSYPQLLSQGASTVLSGRWGRWPNLRRGGLAARDPLLAVATPLRWLTLAALASAVLVIIASQWRTGRIIEASQRVQAQQREAFRDAFPGRRVPVLLMRTVREEYQQVLGARGSGDSVPLPQPATGVLAGLFAGLEAADRKGARFRVLNIDVKDGECSLALRSGDVVQIGVVAKSLEQSGFVVEPPASQQMEPSREEPIATFQSTVNARWNPEWEVAP